MANQQPLWQDIRTYCEERLNEIRAINGDPKHQCPSAFVCIASFLGYLSRLAYGTNVRRDSHDKVWFEDFVKNFMPAKYHPHSELMYRTFRCGIVHSMSFDLEIDSNRTVYLAQNGGMTQGFPSLAITHDHHWDSLCNGNVLVQHQQTGMFVLVADVLCVDIAKAITNMFNNVAVQKNCEEFEYCQRRIQNLPQSIIGVQQPISCGFSSTGLQTNAPSLSSSF